MSIHSENNVNITGGKIQANGGGTAVGLFGGDTAENTGADVLLGGSVEVSAHEFAVANNGAKYNSTLTINGGSYSSEVSSAIYLPEMQSNVNITGGTFTGINGVEIRAGSLEVTGGTFTATPDETTTRANGSGSTTAGTAIAVIQHTTKNPIDVKISDGEFNACTPFYVENPQDNPATSLEQISLEISGGKFTSKLTGNCVPVSSLDVPPNLLQFGKGGYYNQRIEDKYVTDDYAQIKYDETYVQIVKAEGKTVTLAAGIDLATAVETADFLGEGYTVMVTDEIAYQKITNTLDDDDDENVLTIVVSDEISAVVNAELTQITFDGSVLIQNITETLHDLSLTDIEVTTGLEVASDEEGITNVTQTDGVTTITYHDTSSGAEKAVAMLEQMYSDTIDEVIINVASSEYGAFAVLRMPEYENASSETTECGLNEVAYCSDDGLYAGKVMLYTQESNNSIVELAKTVKVNREFIVLVERTVSSALADVTNDLWSRIVGQAYAMDSENAYYVLEFDENAELTGIGVSGMDARMIATIMQYRGVNANIGIRLLASDEISSATRIYIADVNDSVVAEVINDVNAIEYKNFSGVIDGEDFYITIVNGKVTQFNFANDVSTSQVTRTLGNTVGTYKVKFGTLLMEIVDGKLGSPLPGSSNYGVGDYGIPHVENASAGAAGPQGCDKLTPVGVADLFQIDRKGSEATIYFTPVRDNTDRYHVIFGNSEGDERYSGIALYADESRNGGVLAIDIYNLDPAQEYSFKVAPVNECATGEWSNWMTARAVSRSGNSWIKFYRYK